MSFLWFSFSLMNLLAYLTLSFPSFGFFFCIFMMVIGHNIVLYVNIVNGQYVNSED